MTQHASFSTSQELKSAIERGEALVTALEECGRADQAKALKGVVDSARNMRFAIGVVGQAKRGKSTLINGLLGRNDDTLAPVNRFAATNVVSCFADGPVERVTVFFSPDGNAAKTITAAEVKHYACEEFNPGNQKGVKRIEVVAPFARLGKSVVLVDTPGADNALSELHDVVLLDYLPRLDAVIFLVTAGEPFLDSELELLRQVKRADVKKVLFAINKADKCEPDEITQGIEHNRRVLDASGYGDAPVFVTSAKNFQKTGADDGTERLLFAVSELIGEGRAKTIAERLNATLSHYTVEAKEELTAELQLCQMTADQVVAEKAELVALRTRLSASRPMLERKFRSAWMTALREFEDELPGIEKRLASEYGELIERTPSLKLQALGQTVHTDVLKRLDELLEPASQKLRAELDSAGRALEVEYRSIPGLIPEQADALRTNKDIVKTTVELAAAGIPSATAGFILSSLPGLVGSAIATAAPTVAAVTWWNPLTWIAAAGTGTAAAATGAASGAATALLSPLAAIGAPLLFAYTGYRVFTTWTSKLAQSRNALALAVKELIRAAISETRDNFRRLKNQDESILTEFHTMMDAKLDDSERKLERALVKRPAPDRIAHLQQALQLIGRIDAPTTLQDSDKRSPPHRLFPN